MAVKRPDLFDVLEVVREKHGCQSYVYRNMLHSKGHRDFTTALVLARLRMLEHLGKVRLAGNSRFPPYAWDTTADTTSPPTWVTMPVARKPVTPKSRTLTPGA
jgi:hypothetical protein